MSLPAHGEVETNNSQWQGDAERNTPAPLQKFSSPTIVEIKTTTPAPSTNPAMEPKSSQLPINPRYDPRIFRDKDRRAGIYSLPTEKPPAPFYTATTVLCPDTDRRVRGD